MTATKVLAFNASPRGKNGNTERILTRFLEGASEAGAETETIYLREHKIRPCQGCWTCWVKTPGKCAQKDDMPPMLEKIKEADVLVYATPLYNYNMTAYLKILVERMLPLADPHIIKVGGLCAHPLRIGKRWRSVLISNAGFCELDHFDALRATFRRMTRAHHDFAGEIIRPMGELLRQPMLAEALQWFFDAARQAGREVIENGRVSPATEQLLQREIIPEDFFLDAANKFWDAELEKHGNTVSAN